MLVRCPDCGARYDIDETLIPPGGRRVQCSACNHVWQQSPAGEGDQPLTIAAEEEAPRERPPLADDVKAILREEAEREARVRRERGLVELHPEPVAGAASASGRPRPRAPATPVPDADTVNAKLKAASERAAEAHGRRRGRARGGFAAGLVVGFAIVGLAAAVYVVAPRIAEIVPEAEPALDRYVVAVDDLRVTLNRSSDRAVAAVSDLLPADG